MQDGLARARDAQQGLETQPILDAFHQACDGLGLIPRRDIRRRQLKWAGGMLQCVNTMGHARLL